MKRRNFLTVTATAVLGGVVFPGLGSDLVGLAETKLSDVRDLFESADPKVLALAQRVMDKCVLARLRTPTEPLRHMWIQAGGDYYKGQWIWDTMFVVDLFALLPEQKKTIRDIFQNYWDFQERWNKEQPAYAHDMVTVAIKTAPQAVRKFSQIPLLAWGVERVYQRNGDKELLAQCLARLEKFHDWFWRERDVTNCGLIAVGSYSGIVQHARWETYDYDASMDDLKLTPHPTRKGSAAGAWYGDVCVTGNTACLILAERSLARLATIMGDKDMAARREQRIEKSVRAMREHMWDEKTGAFLAVRRDSLKKIPGATIGSWIPLAAGVPTPAMAQRMAEVLALPDWMTPLPVPTLARSDKRWKANAFWRGDVWPATNYQIAAGLAAYGHKDLAADIADRTIANASAHGINEHYDSVSGQGLGVADYSMSCTLVTLMLDGLAKKHTLKLRKRPGTDTVSGNSPKTIL